MISTPVRTKQFTTLPAIITFLAVACLGACAVAPQTCELVQVADLPVTFVAGEPTVLIKIRNYTLRMIVDTGAQYSVISPATARLLSASSVYGSLAQAEGPNGSVNTVASYAGSYTLGNIMVQEAYFYVAALPTSARHSAEKINGILGEDILSNDNLALDFPQKEIHFFKRYICKDAFPFAGEFASLPFSTSTGGQPEITIFVDGKPLKVILDTGAVGSVFSESAVQDAGITALSDFGRRKTIGIGGLVSQVDVDRFANVTIGGEVFGPSSVAVQKSESFGGADGVVGEDYLRDHKVFINYDTHTVWLGTRVSAHGS